MSFLLYLLSTALVDCRRPHVPITWRRRRLSRAAEAHPRAHWARMDAIRFLCLSLVSAVNQVQRERYPWPGASSFSGCVDDTLEGILCAEVASQLRSIFEDAFDLMSGTRFV